MADGKTGLFRVIPGIYDEERERLLIDTELGEVQDDLSAGDGRSVRESIVNSRITTEEIDDAGIEGFLVSMSDETGSPRTGSNIGNDTRRVEGQDVKSNIPAAQIAVGNVGRLSDLADHDPAEGVPHIKTGAQLGGAGGRVVDTVRDAISSEGNLTKQDGTALITQADGKITTEVKTQTGNTVSTETDYAKADLDTVIAGTRGSGDGVKGEKLRNAANDGQLIDGSDQITTDMKTALGNELSGYAEDGKTAHTGTTKYRDTNNPNPPSAYAAGTIVKNDLQTIQIPLTWTPPAGAIDGYTLRYAVGDDSSVVIDATSPTIKLSADATGFVIEGISDKKYIKTSIKSYIVTNTGLLYSTAATANIDRTAGSIQFGEAQLPDNTLMEDDGDSSIRRKDGTTQTELDRMRQGLMPDDANKTLESTFGAQAKIDRSGMVFFRSFDEYSSEADLLKEWERNTSGAEVSFVAGGAVGGQVLQLGNNSGSDAYRMATKTLIPYDPTKLYRISVRLYHPAGTGVDYVGVLGVAADGTTLINADGLNSWGSHFYRACSGVSPGSYTVYQGYISGLSGTPDQLAKNDPNAPGPMYTDTKFIRPLILANWSSQPGTVYIDWIKLETVDKNTEMGLGNVANANFKSTGEYKADVLGADDSKLLDAATKKVTTALLTPSNNALGTVADNAEGDLNNIVAGTRGAADGIKGAKIRNAANDGSLIDGSDQITTDMKTAAGNELSAYAEDGKTAHTGTTKYRQTGDPDPATGYGAGTIVKNDLQTIQIPLSWTPPGTAIDGYTLRYAVGDDSGVTIDASSPTVKLSADATGFVIEGISDKKYIKTSLKTYIVTNAGLKYSTAVTANIDRTSGSIQFGEAQLPDNTLMEDDGDNSIRRKDGTTQTELDRVRQGKLPGDASKTLESETGAQGRADEAAGTGAHLIANTASYNSGGGFHTNAGQWGLYITVDTKVHIGRVLINSSGANNATLQLLADPAGTVLKSKAISVVDGLNWVNVDWTVPAGNYHFGLAGAWSGTGAYRNTSGAYPYDSGSFHITDGGNFGGVPNHYYYYFYDFEIGGADVEGRIQTTVLSPGGDGLGEIADNAEGDLNSIVAGTRGSADGVKGAKIRNAANSGALIDGSDQITTDMKTAAGNELSAYAEDGKTAHTGTTKYRQTGNPNAPTGYSAGTVVKNDLQTIQIPLTWSAPAGAIDGYTLRYAVGDTSGVTIDASSPTIKLSADATGFVIEGISDKKYIKTSLKAYIVTNTGLLYSTAVTANIDRTSGSIQFGEAALPDNAILKDVGTGDIKTADGTTHNELTRLKDGHLPDDGGQDLESQTGAQTKVDTSIQDTIRNIDPLTARLYDFDLDGYDSQGNHDAIIDDVNASIQTAVTKWGAASVTWDGDGDVRCYPISETQNASGFFWWRSSHIPSTGDATNHMFWRWYAADSGYYGFHWYNTDPFLDPTAVGETVNHTHMPWTPIADTWYFAIWRKHSGATGGMWLEIYDTSGNKLQGWGATLAGWGAKNFGWLYFGDMEAGNQFLDTCVLYNYDVGTDFLRRIAATQTKFADPARKAMPDRVTFNYADSTAKGGNAVDTDAVDGEAASSIKTKTNNADGDLNNIVAGTRGAADGIKAAKIRNAANTAALIDGSDQITTGLKTATGGTLSTNADDGKTAHTDTTQFRGDTVPGSVPVYSAISKVDNDDGSTEVTITWTYSQHATNKAHGFIVRWSQGASSGQTVNTASASRKLDNTVRKFSITMPQNKYISFGVSAYYTAKTGTKETAIQTHANWTDYRPNTEVTLPSSVAEKWQFPSDENLVGHWSFDDLANGTAKDSSPNGNHAVVAGNVGVEQGVSGRAAVATAADQTQYIKFLDDAEAGAMENKWLMSAWFKSDETAGSESDVRLIGRDASDYWTVYLNQTEAGPQDLSWYYGQSQYATYTNLVSTGEWHHLVIAVDRSNNRARLYLDNSLVGNISGTINIATSSRPIVAFCNTEDVPNPTLDRFGGSLDEVRFYDGYDWDLLDQYVRAFYKFPAGPQGAQSVDAQTVGGREAAVIKQGIDASGNITAQDGTELITQSTKKVTTGLKTPGNNALGTVADNAEGDLNNIVAGTRGSADGIKASKLRNNANSAALIDTSDQITTGLKTAAGNGLSAYAEDGKTAHTGTTKYRTVSAPNDPTGYAAGTVVKNDLQTIQIPLTWTPPAGNLDGYTLRYAVGDTSGVTIDASSPTIKLSADATGFIIEGISDKKYIKTSLKAYIVTNAGLLYSNAVTANIDRTSGSIQFGESALPDNTVVDDSGTMKRKDAGAVTVDSLPDGSTYKRTTQNEKTGGGRGYEALTTSYNLVATKKVGGDAGVTGSNVAGTHDGDNARLLGTKTTLQAGYDKPVSNVVGVDGDQYHVKAEAGVEGKVKPLGDIHDEASQSREELDDAGIEGFLVSMSNETGSPRTGSNIGNDTRPVEGQDVKSSIPAAQVALGNVGKLSEILDHDPTDGVPHVKAGALLGGAGGRDTTVVKQAIGGSGEFKKQDGSNLIDNYGNITDQVRVVQGAVNTGLLTLSEQAETDLNAVVAGTRGAADGIKAAKIRNAANSAALIDGSDQITTGLKTAAGNGLSAYAEDGKTAHTGTTKYRSVSAPNDPTAYAAGTVVKNDLQTIQIPLTWSAPAGNLDGYTLRYAVGDTSGVTIDATSPTIKLSADATGFVIEGISDKKYIKTSLKAYIVTNAGLLYSNAVTANIDRTGGSIQFGEAALPDNAIIKDTGDSSIKTADGSTHTELDRLRQGQLPGDASKTLESESGSQARADEAAGTGVHVYAITPVHGVGEESAITAEAGIKITVDTKIHIGRVSIWTDGAVSGTIELTDAGGSQVLKSKAVSLSSGKNLVTLDWILPAGSYRLKNSSAGWTGGNNVYRHTATNVSYPYDSGSFHVTESTSNNGYYYWFYEIEIGGTDVEGNIQTTVLSPGGESLGTIADEADADLNAVIAGTRGSADGVKASKLRNNANNAALIDTSDQISTGLKTATGETLSSEVDNAKADLAGVLNNPGGGDGVILATASLVGKTNNLGAIHDDADNADTDLTALAQGTRSAGAGTLKLQAPKIVGTSAEAIFDNDGGVKVAKASKNIPILDSTDGYELSQKFYNSTSKLYLRINSGGEYERSDSSTSDWYMEYFAEEIKTKKMTVYTGAFKTSATAADRVGLLFCYDNTTAASATGCFLLFNASGQLVLYKRASGAYSDSVTIASSISVGWHQLAVEVYGTTPDDGSGSVAYRIYLDGELVKTVYTTDAQYSNLYGYWGLYFRTDSARAKRASADGKPIFGYVDGLTGSRTSLLSADGKFQGPQLAEQFGFNLVVVTSTGSGSTVALADIEDTYSDGTNGYSIIDLRGINVKSGTFVRFNVAPTYPIRAIHTYDSADLGTGYWRGTMVYVEAGGGVTVRLCAEDADTPSGFPSYFSSYDQLNFDPEDWTKDMWVAWGNYPAIMNIAAGVRVGLIGNTSDWKVQTISSYSGLRNYLAGGLNLGNSLQVAGTVAIDTSRNGSFADVSASGSYKMDGSAIINTSGEQTGVMKTRAFFVFGRNATLTNSGGTYSTSYAEARTVDGATNGHGYRMPMDCKVVGISFQCDVLTVTSSEAPPDAVKVILVDNGTRQSSVYCQANVIATGDAGAEVNVGDTGLSAAYSFSKGDRMGIDVAVFKGNVNDANTAADDWAIVVEVLV